MKSTTNDRKLHRCSRTYSPWPVVWLYRGYRIERRTPRGWLFVEWCGPLKGVPREERERQWKALAPGFARVREAQLAIDGLLE